MTATNFLSDYRPYTNNTRPLISIDEPKAESLVLRHSHNGYIFLPLLLNQRTMNGEHMTSPQAVIKAQISKAVIEIIQKIKVNGYSYTPIYGKFIIDNGQLEEQVEYLRSFIIYNQDYLMNTGDFEKLYEVCLEMAIELCQPGLLVCEPHDKPKFTQIDGTIGNIFTTNDLSEICRKYYRILSSELQKAGIIGWSSSCHNYQGSYINPQPMCYSEAHIRYLLGERTLSYRS